ncbi:MAG TPA: hypothetical protein VJ326_09490 [Thermoplasmata archaeon]|nr:hypothetical protein [Thermoplasmata archaeon]
MQPELSIPCPTCGGDLTFLDQYQRHFCYACQQYAPEGYGARGANKCPTCTGILSYVAVYDRFFCYRCQQYAGPEAIGPQAPTPREAPPSVAAGPTGATRTPEAEGTPETSDAGPEAPAEAPVAEPPIAAEEPTEDEFVVVEQPPLSRELIGSAKKPLLLDLCKAYDLDASGTKDDLRERLLSYLEEQESAARAEEPGPVPEEIPTEAEVPEEPEGTPEAGPGPIPYETPTEPEAELASIEPPSRPEPIERAPEPTPEPVPTSIPEATRAPPAVPTLAEHPCPRCGRELDYIAQYDRWFCHSCRTYAPRRAFRHACPTCGTTLRWIERYERWWCDAEQKYAPSDLPTPEAGSSPALATAAAVAGPATVAQAIVRPAIEIHRHRSPGAGIGVAAFGLFLWLTYQLAVAVPAAFGAPPPVPIPSDVAFVLQFLGMLLLGGGVIVGLSALRDRR